MPKGIVIEGHVIQEISKAIASENGELFQLISWIIANCGIAWNEHIDVHWHTKCGHRDEAFWAWFEDQNQKRNVHIVPPVPLSEPIMHRISEFGLPPDSFNKHYLECANGTDRPRYIIADEIDLHDPTEKMSSLKRKEQIRKRESGALAKYIKKKAKITIKSKDNSYNYLCVHPLCASTCTINCHCLLT